LTRIKLITENFVTSSDQQNQKPILTFNGKRYDINSLSEKSKELLQAAQVADAQIKMQEDNLKLLNVARQSIGSQLSQELQNAQAID
tara:strand:- start:889 stop:1149 length:261 start_codon:yes stop_codon:yes gene_type:complete